MLINDFLFEKVAERQGKYLAKSLAEDNLPPFRFQPRGMLAYIGEYKGLTDTPVAKSQGTYSQPWCSQ